MFGLLPCNPLHPPHVHGREEVRRSYSISSLPQQLWEIAITVKRVPGGRASPFLLDDLAPGSVVHALPPAGAFVLKREPQVPGSARLHVGLGAGAGVVPVLPLLEQAATAGQAVACLSCQRSTEEAVLAPRLRALGGRAVHCRTHYSAGEGRCDAAALHGFLEEVVRRNAGPGASGPGLAEAAAAGAMAFYLCGPAAWMGMVRAALLDLGTPAECIVAESFGSGDRAFGLAAEGATAAAREVVLTHGARGQAHGARAKTTLHVDAGASILDAADAVALPIPSGCRGGECGRCVATLCSGRVLDMEDGIIDKPGASIRTCRTTPVSSDVSLQL